MAMTQPAPSAVGRRSSVVRPYGDLVSQYLELRDQHPGVLLLFRVGSFYEVLFEDAELVARELGLKLGERPSGGSAGPVPQCGFAHHALDAFLPRLLGRGYRVAVCEEEDSPLPLGEGQGEGNGEGRGLRRRGVVRTLTPGTVTDPRLLREDRPTYLVAIAAAEERVGLAWTDVAAGEFQAGEFAPDEAAAEIERLDPAEVLLPSDRRVPDGLLTGRNVTPLGPSEGADERLRRAFPEAELGDLPLARAAAGLAVGYLEATRAADAAALESPQQAAPERGLRLDAATQRHLELVETERSQERAGSLLATLDRTVSPMGRRMLRSWVLRPLTDLAKIGVRQRIVAELVAEAGLRAALRERLRETSDLERLAGRAAARQATLDDLHALAAVAGQLPLLARVTSASRSPFLRALGRPRPGLAAFADRARALLAAPGDEPAVRPEASAALARALAALRDARAWQARYVEQLRRQPALGRLKLERSSTQGLFFEVPVNTKVPAEWVRRGGLQKIERYSTPALEEHAVALAEAEAVVASETKALLAELRAAAAAAAGEARDLARHLAAADALASLADVAAERGWVQPAVDSSSALVIEQGRHPVIEADGPFQPNDARLEARGGADQLVVLTGPNMAGKSTWMRQIALTVLLAQIGSSVPAARAQIGLVDAIFTRIGAVDDLAAGRSTFMVEMEETASLLRGVTDSSLVMLDEIGRGTSTHDGMAIAWAVVEHLATGPVRPRAVAATHYHELAALNAALPQVKLLRATVEERPDGIAFPHRIEPGAADRSFGIEVARLAGLPAPVLARAREVADAIEPLSAEIARRLGDVGGPAGASTAGSPRRRAAG
jgi:DNA mismatch repair protein MutS